MIIVYQAIDGTLFKTMKECEEYEVTSSLNSFIVNTIQKDIKKWVDINNVTRVISRFIILYWKDIDQIIKDSYKENPENNVPTESREFLEGKLSALFGERIPTNRLYYTGIVMQHIDAIYKCFKEYEQFLISNEKETK